MRILVIRRDNIGNLVCTTLVFCALRQKNPQAYIAALVNSCCAPVLDGSPALDTVFVYIKAKHGSNESRLATLSAILRLLWKLRTMRFDVVVTISEASAAMAAWLKPRRIFRASDKSRADGVPLACIDPLHAVEAAFAYLKPLGVAMTPRLLVLYPAGDRVRRLKGDGESRSEPVMGPSCATSRCNLPLAPGSGWRSSAARWATALCATFARLRRRFERGFDIGATSRIFSLRIAASTSF